MSNRWIDRFDGLLDRDIIRNRAQIKAVPLSGLNAETPQTAYERLNDALKGFCFISDEDLDVLVAILSSGIGYSERAYASEAMFLETLHLEEPPSCSIEPKCLSGLAGTGKSDLLRAAERVTPNLGTFCIPSHIPSDFELIGSKRITISTKTTLHHLLGPLLPEDARPTQINASGMPERKPRIRASAEALIIMALKHSYASGIANLFVDETQFGSHSSDASARIMSWLLVFCRFPMPFTYAVNFDLGARLFRRHEHDHDRILCKPLILAPPTLGSEGMRGYLRECEQVMSGVLGIDLVNQEELIFRLTANVRRKVRRLLALSYEQARKRGKYEIEVCDLDSAYASPQFAAMREDVNAIFKQSLAGKVQPGRKDLWCPFGREFNILPTEAAAVAKKSVGDTYASALMRQDMTQQEKGVRSRPLRPSAQAGSEPTSEGKHAGTQQKKQGGKVINLSQRNALTKDLLLRNTIDHKDDK